VRQSFGCRNDVESLDRLQYLSYKSLQVQMIVGMYEFLPNVNRSSVNVSISTMNSSVAEASTCKVKYFNEASVLYMFWTLDFREINDKIDVFLTMRHSINLLQLPT
jgi:hypothetical protein